MSWDIELNEQVSQPVLSIRTTTTMELLPKIIGESFMKIANYLGQLGEQPADAPYTAYYSIDMQNLDVEIGFPVRQSLPEKGEIKAGEIPCGLIVSCMYKGPYSGMEKIYTDMFQWIADNHYVYSGVSYEYYFNSPAEVLESELVTRVVLPVTKE